MKANLSENDNYVSIGFGRYKEKGKEKDPNAPTFTKDDSGKFVPTKTDSGKTTQPTKSAPKVNIFDKPKQSEPSQSQSTVQKGDFVLYKPTNSAATVIDRFGRGVTLRLPDGKKVKTVINKVGLLAQDGVENNGEMLEMKNNIIRLKSILLENDNFVSIGFGRYKQKGKEKDPNAPTFKKDDAGKFVPTKSDTSKGGDEPKKAAPKVNIFDKPVEEPKADAPKATPADLAVDKVVYNTRTKSVGIVRMADERGETKTDADGNVNSSELEPYNPMKYPHQKDAKVAPSTQKEVDARGLWNPFSTGDEPKAAEPKPQRKGNPQVNKAAKAKAEKLGITPQKLGKDEYQKKMAQAAYEALTDANFHSEARELIAKLEGKPELAEKPDYPNPSDPKFDEKMTAIRTKYASEYSDDVEDDARELGVSVSQESSWSGDDAVDGIAFTLRMNGFHKLADTIQSVIKESVSTKLTSLIKK